MKKILCAVAVLMTLCVCISAQGNAAKADKNQRLQLNAGYGFTHVSWSDPMWQDAEILPIVDEVLPSISFGVKYTLQEVFGADDFFVSANARYVLFDNEYPVSRLMTGWDGPLMYNEIIYKPEFSLYIINAGIGKKISITNVDFELNVSAGYLIVNTCYELPYQQPIEGTFSGSSLGFSIYGGVAYAVVPKLAVYAKVMYDRYASPESWDIEYTNGVPSL